MLRGTGYRRRRVGAGSVVVEIDAGRASTWWRLIDYRARYFNYSGLGVVGAARLIKPDDLIDELLLAGTQVAQAIGPWTKASSARAQKRYCAH